MQLIYGWCGNKWCGRTEEILCRCVWAIRCIQIQFHRIGQNPIDLTGRIIGDDTGIGGGRIAKNADVVDRGRCSRRQAHIAEHNNRWIRMDFMMIVMHCFPHVGKITDMTRNLNHLKII